MSDLDIETNSIGNSTQTVLWESRVDIDEDEINPDTLRTLQNMLLDSLEDAVEHDERGGAANWSTYMVHLQNGLTIATQFGKIFSRFSVSVRAL